ncbi:MAG: glycoside hydrolase family 127 protein, partial [Candidatus Aminicenantes bacterium]|nr:glycoside hydrolase family 127 protein [Candidatus Aminicenantes bacterium]
FVGHYLTACALMYALTEDLELKKRADYLISELARCQQALGKSGYLSAFPEDFIDRVIARQRVWAPWYTLHKIMAGLLDMYRYAGNKQAMKILEKMASWVKFRLDKLTPEQIQAMLQTEFGGMNEVLTNLYAYTGHPDHLALARKFDHHAFFEPLAARRDELKGLHVNTQIPKVIGAVREYLYTGEKKYYDLATFFWRQVVDHRCYVTGGTSNYEAWRTEPGQMSTELSNATHETCCTYNLLKLTKELFCLQPDPYYADYYERALFNGILPTQDPATGMTMYYVPMESGWYKTFSTPYDSFWCCTGTGIENPPRAAEAIYFRDDDGIYINLFIASEVIWPEKGLRLRQETKFPEEEKTTLTLNLKKPTKLAFRLRVPYWATKGAELFINGEKKMIVAIPGTYIRVEETWRDGDRLEFRLPMSLHLWPIQDDPHLAAILYGPIVLAGQLPSEPLKEKEIYGPYHARGKKVRAPDLVANMSRPEDWLVPVDNQPLTFKTDKVGRPEDVTLIPFYKLFNQRYAIYWHFYDEAGWKRAEETRLKKEKEREIREKEIARRLVDKVEIGDETSEKAHNLRGERTRTGENEGRIYREARDEGWFSYDLKVLPDQPLVLVCTYWGSDLNREFDIFVDGEKIASQRVNVNFPGDFFEVEYPVPFELTKGKTKITVKFQPHPGSIAGGVYACLLIKK